MNNDVLDKYWEGVTENAEKEIIHRMKMIIDDAQVVIEHFEQGKRFEERTKCADNVWTHLSNIEIAVDLTSKESSTWKKFTT